MNGKRNYRAVESLLHLVYKKLDAVTFMFFFLSTPSLAYSKYLGIRLNNIS